MLEDSLKATRWVWVTKWPRKTLEVGEIAKHDKLRHLKRTVLFEMSSERVSLLLLRCRSLRPLKCSLLDGRLDTMTSSFPAYNLRKTSQRDEHFHGLSIAGFVWLAAMADMYNGIFALTSGKVRLSWAARLILLWQYYMVKLCWDINQLFAGLRCYRILFIPRKGMLHFWWRHTKQHPSDHGRRRGGFFKQRVVRGLSIQDCRKKTKFGRRQNLLE
jgi:hypothetical protein